MKPITESEAKNLGIFYEVTKNDTIKTITNFVMNYNKSELFVRTASGKDKLIDMRAKSLNMLDVYDPATGEKIADTANIIDVISMLIKASKQTKEISNGTSIIFLDTYNLDWHLDNAVKIQKKYGSNKIEDMKITGDSYLEKVRQMIQVANDIMDGKLVPDIFDQIPIKKDKTFQENRTIPIFMNGVINAASYDSYVNKQELMLCIVPYGTWIHDKHFDLSEETNKKRAKLCLVWHDGAKKIVPLIAKDLSINDIKTKASYLKDDDIKAGCIYKEKSGSEYLYLGNILIIDEEDIRLGYRIDYTCHTYIRMTKKVQAIIDKSSSLDEFLKLYAQDIMAKEYKSLPLSYRENPRKFVEMTAGPFINSQFSVTNPTNVKPCNIKYLFSVTTLLYDKTEKSELQIGIIK